MAHKIEATLKSDFGVMGINDGKQIADALKAGYTVLADKLQTIAEDIHANEQGIADWLLGFADSMKKGGFTDGTVRTKKSEAKSVIMAYHCIMLQGHELHDDKGNSLGSSIVVESDTLFALPYHAMVARSREIVEAHNAGRQRTSPTEPKVKAISADDCAKVIQRLGVSSGSTLLDAANKIQNVLIKQLGTPEILVEQSLPLAEQLAQNTDQFYAKIGSKIVAELQKAVVHGAELQKKRIADAQAELDKETAKAGKPTPATVVNALAILETASDAELEQQIQEAEAQQQTGTNG